MPRSGDHQ
nr:unnamed protein product [Callosobruchus chinensis]